MIHYGSRVVFDHGDGGVTFDAVAALVGNFGLDQTNRLAGHRAALHFVGSGTASNDVALNL